VYNERCVGVIRFTFLRIIIIIVIIIIINGLTSQDLELYLMNDF
jgi:hypothetical protein